MDKYNKLVSLENEYKYPFNLISNLKSNIVETKKEIEIEYIKQLRLTKDINNKDNKIGGTQQTITIYLF